MVHCEKATFLPLTLTHPAIQYKGSRHGQSGKVDLNYSKILQQTLEIYKKNQDADNDETILQLYLPPKIVDYIRDKLQQHCAYTKAENEQKNEILNTILLHAKFIYLYTIENPSIYCGVNQVLSNKKFWQEGIQCYKKPSNIRYKDLVMIDYAVCMIDSLFILSKLKIIDGFCNIKMVGKELYRGIKDVTQTEMNEQFFYRSR